MCGKSPVEKVLYPVAVHYKGSGFYSTDYGKGGRKAVAAKDGGGSSGDSGSSGSSDSSSSPAKDTGGSSSTDTKPTKSAD